MKYKEVYYTRSFYYSFSKPKVKGIKLKFRFDPVPGTGGYKNLGRFYRNIKTTQERKFCCDPEHKPYIRGKRSMKNLPEAWDDIWNSKELIKKSWKRTKKRKQWM